MKKRGSGTLDLRAFYPVLIFFCLKITHFGQLLGHFLTEIEKNGVVVLWVVEKEERGDSVGKDKWLTQSVFGL
jgi:hypothetical protein